MAREFTYRCDKCANVQCVRLERRYYVPSWQSANVPLEERIHCFEEEAWCRRCARIRAVETLTPLAELKQIKEGDPDDPDWEPTPGIDGRIRWREERVAPP